MSKKAIITKLKKTIAVLESPHVREVKVTFRGTDDDDVRVYEARTIVRGKTHRYIVRVQDFLNDETNEMNQDFRCNCPSRGFGLKCRHILKVAEVDAELLNRNLHTEIFQTYRSPEQSKQAELTQMFNELPESVQKDVLMLVRAFHKDYGFSK